MDQYIGKLLDNRYEILEVIGTGGMAVVYKARCHRLNRLVAIKVLREDLAKDAEFRRRFHDESQAVAMLSHPNIMAVHDVSRSSELEYIVMELIDGITLKQYMQKKGMPLNWREALHFITQIAKALSHAHSRGIIHRDIKPQNIMVLRDGSVKVTDFGIARLASATQNTLTQEALGSVHYISPEQARGSRIDVRSDLYSAGVVLYEMLTGCLPFEGDTPVSVAIQHINSIPLAPREHNVEIPEALEAITLKAMASNMDQRYATADVMLADLEEFRKNPSINFEYTPADLFRGECTDEPTQVIDTGRRFNGRKGRLDNFEEEDDDLDDRRDRRRRGSQRGGFGSAGMAVAAILIFIVGIGVFLWVTFFSGIFAPADNGVEVPDFAGMTMEEILADKDFTSAFEIEEAAQTVASDTVPEGQVVSQEPKAGNIVKGEEKIVVVTLSGGQSEITMPDLVNKDYRLAQSELARLDIDTAAPEYETSETITQGFVISTDPVANTALTAGTQVKLVISLGPDVKKVTVINFVGSSLDTVEGQMKVMGLKMGTVKYEQNDAAKDTVFYQSVANKQEVPEGSGIDFKVSLGPDGEETPTPTPGESPTPTPDVTTSPVPTPSPIPSQSIPVGVVQVASRAIKITLPAGDTDTVQVRIDVGGVTKYDNPVQRNLSPVSPSVQGSGKQTVTIYIDGVFYESREVDFSS